jgi:pyrophosphatase PpaX
MVTTMPNDIAPGKAVLFDVDGTLLDTIPLITESYQHAFQTCLGYPGDPDAILASIGIPLDTFFLQFDPELAKLMKKTYLEYNHAHLETHTGVFLRVPEILRRLQAQGVPLGIVTSKRLSSAMFSLTEFNLDNFFQALVAMETTERHKPDPEPVFAAMRQLRLDDPSRVVFIGDSIHDLICAKRAGCRSAIVDWTAMPTAELKAAGPDLWLENAGQLMDFLDSI